MSLCLCVLLSFPYKSVSLLLFTEQSLPTFLSSYPRLTVSFYCLFLHLFILPHVSFLTPVFSPSISLLLPYPLLHLCFEVTTGCPLSKGASYGSSAFSQCFLVCVSECVSACDQEIFVSNLSFCQGIQPVRTDRMFKQYPL